MKSPNSISFEGSYPPSRLRSYETLAFDVPEGTARIDVSYNCVSDPGSVLIPGENLHDFFADILLFDPRGAEFQGAGYRGTSGNSRRSIFVAADEATPGYMPGTIQVGTWSLVMGFYKIAPSGTHYEVNIRLSDQGATTAAEPQRLPLRSTSEHTVNPTGWYKGDLHCHTFHSDGTPSPTEVVREAESLGLDFLAITDHNTFTQDIELNTVETDVILIPGCEVSTFYGHWNIWGYGGWIECRPNTEAEMAETYREAVRQGYLTSLNHPRPEGPPWRFPDVVGNQCVEVWNGPWEDHNDLCLGFWEKKINAGQRLVAVGGSDCHQLNTPGEGQLARPMMYVRCEGEPSAVGILDGIRAGHAFVTNGPTGPQLYLTSSEAEMGDALARPASGRLSITVRVIDGDGAQLETWTSAGQVATQIVAGADATYTFEIDVAATPYVRAQLRDVNSQFMLAVTNPIYLDD